MGRIDNDSSNDDCFAQFSIVRPMDEGVRPTVENGFNAFEHLRGDCGTRVTIRLNEKAVEAGLLVEDNLKPIFAKIFETSQYTVAFSSDEEAQDIIDASRKEDEDAVASKNEDEVEPLDASAVNEEVSGLIGQSACSLSGVAGSPLSCCYFISPFEMDETTDDPLLGTGSHNTVKERAKYIPLRLSLGERKMLRLVEAAMTCCDYTTEVDRPFKSVARRTHAQLKGVTSVLRGLVTACDYNQGQVR